MTRLRLVANAPEPRLAELAPLAPERLSPGRHGLPADIVRTHQRQRLLEAAAAALAEQGYGRLTAARITELAGVSSRTFYQHFEDLWACLLAAYETEGGFLCSGMEDACRELPEDDRLGRGRAGIGAGIDFLASEPAVARLLSAEPPPQIVPLAAARRDLTERLGTMLRAILEPGSITPLPGLERRLVAAAMALVSTRAASGEPQRLRDLEPELSQLLLASLQVL
jgi:AcrR family transcriptional regulator